MKIQELIKTYSGGEKSNADAKEFFLLDKHERTERTQLMWESKAREARKKGLHQEYFQALNYCIGNFFIGRVRVMKELSFLRRNEKGIRLEKEAIEFFPEEIRVARKNHPQYDNLWLCVFRDIVCWVPYDILKMLKT